MSKWLRKISLLAALGGLSGCFWFDENETSQLVGNYQLVETSDGNNFLYFDDPARGPAEPLLAGISATGIAGTYLVVAKSGQYYLFSLLPTTDEAVRRTCVGPLHERVFRVKLYELTGDSTLQLTSKIQ